MDPLPRNSENSSGTTTSVEEDAINSKPPFNIPLVEHHIRRRRSLSEESRPVEKAFAEQDVTVTDGRACDQSKCWTVDDSAPPSADSKPDQTNNNDYNNFNRYFDWTTAEAIPMPEYERFLRSRPLYAAEQPVVDSGEPVPDTGEPEIDCGEPMVDCDEPVEIACAECAEKIKKLLQVLSSPEKTNAEAAPKPEHEPILWSPTADAEPAVNSGQPGVNSDQQVTDCVEPVDAAGAECAGQIDKQLQVPLSEYFSPFTVDESIIASEENKLKNLSGE